MDLCLQLLKESNKKLVQCQEQCIDHIPYITFWDCRIQIFSDNLSRNSCIDTLYWYNLYDEQYFCNVLFLEISTLNFAWNYSFNA